MVLSRTIMAVLTHKCVSYLVLVMFAMEGNAMTVNVSSNTETTVKRSNLTEFEGNKRGLVVTVDPVHRGAKQIDPVDGAAWNTTTEDSPKFSLQEGSGNITGNVSLSKPVHVTLLSLDKATSDGARELGPNPCKKAAVCEPLKFATCFGATLPFKHTSVALVENATNQTEIQRQLQMWQGLRSVPRCWSVIQPLLCAVYMPRCENGSVDVPSQELCRMVRSPCRAVESFRGWPEFLKCENQSLFSYQCKNDWREVKFNSSARCPLPLVETDHVLSWYPGIDGCGMPCQNPLFTLEEHYHVHTFIVIIGSICLSCCLFTVVTFAIDWRSASKYPALIVFYINCCFLIVSVGWLAQFTIGAREDIVCRKDGTLRQREPSAGENLSCVVIFIMVYYFIMAAVVWFVMLTYSWFVAFRALGKVREAMEAKTAYFHLVAWSAPLVLTIAVLALGQIDGDSVSGICFVGFSNFPYRVGFVLIPVAIGLFAGGFFLVRGLEILVALKIDSSSVVNERANAKISETIRKLASMLVLAILLVITSTICHLYEYLNREKWQQGFKDYLLCKATTNTSASVHAVCSFDSRPSVHIVQLHLVLVFGTGIMMSSWVWTASTLETWKRFLRRLCRQPVNEPVKLKKHKMIAKTFARRNNVQNGHHHSISFYSTHDDPLGMNFDVNSGESQEVSSTWAANISKFVTRRGALMGAGALGLGRNSSATEEMGFRRGSVELFGTRRHSLDSQISIAFIEQERLAYLAQARQQRRLKKKELKRRAGRIEEWHERRRGSDASQHSLPERKPSNLDKHRLPLRPSTAFNKGPQQSELPVLAPLRSHQRTSSWSGSKAADDLLRLGTSASSGEDIPSLFLPGQVDFHGSMQKRFTRNSQRSHRGSGGSKKKDFSSKRKDSLSTDNESVRNWREQLGDAIIGAVYGSRVSLDRQSNDATTAPKLTAASLNNPGAKTGKTTSPQPAVELKVLTPAALNNSHHTRQGVPSLSTEKMRPNDLRQYPLLSRTTIDIDGDSDIRESSSS